MTDLVSSDAIEGIVGVLRHRHLHYGRPVSDHGIFYILHSMRCLETFDDLRLCRFSMALERGLDMKIWKSFEDQPVVLKTVRGYLLPYTPPEPA